MEDSLEAISHNTKIRSPCTDTVYVHARHNMLSIRIRKHTAYFVITSPHLLLNDKMTKQEHWKQKIEKGRGKG